MQNIEKIVILGGGESGVGAAILGKKQGYEVFLSDKGFLKDTYKQVLIDYQIEFEEGQHTEDKILQADWVIKSPGVPKKAEILQKIRDKGIEISSEIEMASRYTDAKLIAITGSNGKTTTTSLIYHIFKEAGLHVGLAGNIGKSFAWQVAEDDYDYYVLEISSFQLDDIQTFKPNVALVLNISPDHLNEYQYELMNYAKAKWRITENQSEDDYLIYNIDDDILNQLKQDIPTKAKLVPFSLKQVLDYGAYSINQEININLKKPYTMTITELSLVGKHNIANSLAAAASANIMNIRNEQVRKSLSDFEAVEHRLEFVLKIHGMRFINDSKATNVNAVYYALESMEVPTVWIVGGEDKGNDYSELKPLVAQKVRAIVCLGVDNKKIVQEFQDIVPNIVETNNMQDAVRTAYMLGRKGDNILLSPACASFDLFKNYEDRGTQFKEEVRRL